MSGWARFQRVLALLRDPRTPKLPRLLVGLAVAYLLWPVDLVPDLMIPVAGFADDLTLLWLSVRWLFKSGEAAQPQPNQPDAGRPVAPG
jgi:uncharacterized membrane protein YkvA (DUF1232 family)